MQSSPTNIADIFKEFSMNGMYMAFYIAALIYVLVKCPSNIKRTFLYPVLFLLLTVFNPWLVPILINISGESMTYYRFFWILPIIMLLAYVAVNSLFKMKTLRKKIFFIICFVLILVIGGMPITKSGVGVIQNRYKYPVEYMEIIRLINADWQSNASNAEEMPIAASADGPNEQIRLFDPGIKLAWGRYGVPAKYKEIFTLCAESEALDTDLLFEQIEKNSVNYLIINSANKYRDILDSAGYSHIGDSGSYSLYKTYS